MSTTTARQRRKHWQTPLPVTDAPARRATSKNGGTTSTSAAPFLLCLSLLCVVVLVGAALVATSRSIPSSPLSTSDGRRRQARRARAPPVTHATLDQITLSSSRPYDAIVVGCGPAGLTAALFASRMGLSVLVCGSPSGGSLSGTDRLDNFPSFLGRHADGGSSGQGQGWVDATMEQVHFGAEFAPPASLATGLSRTQVRNQNVFEVRLGSDAKALGRTVIVASGSSPRKLSLPNEASLWGRSLHNCALCDGDAYSSRDGTKKSVAVIGGGDAAVEAVSLLHRLGVDAIHWIHRREEYRASPADVDRVRRLPGVEVWAPYAVVEWMVRESDDGSPGELEGVRIVGAVNSMPDPEAASTLTIPCDGAFLTIGSTPNSDWLRGSGADVDPTSKLIRIATSSTGGADGVFSTSTSVPGVFAAGEVVDGIYRQALTASSDGAKAAIDAERYLRHVVRVEENNTPSVQQGRSRATNDRREVSPRRVQTAKAKRSEREDGTAGPVDCDLTKTDCIKSVVSTHPLVVFSKGYCPHCRRALEALRSFAEPLVLDLTEIEGGFQVQDALATITGRRTVPNVFVGGKSIGGGDETTALFREGKLGELLRKAGAIQ